MHPKYGTRPTPMAARQRHRALTLASCAALLILFLSGAVPARAADSVQPDPALSKELTMLADQGDLRAQYLVAYLVFVGRMTDKSIPSLSDQKRANAQAKAYLEKAVASGYAPAELLLGNVYLSGNEDVPKDLKRARELFRKAAEAGNADAENAFGKMLHAGEGGARDDQAAVGWFQKAVAQDQKHAMANLGYMYANGLGVAQDDRMALDLTRKAATAGVPEALHNLGWIYGNGRGVDKDNAEALRWYTAAAEKGYGPSQLNLGFIYAKGEGGGDVRTQLVTAVKWLALAATSTDGPTSATAKKAIAYIAERQKPDIVADGVSEAKKWAWAH